jgi:hypothetical protein
LTRPSPPSTTADDLKSSERPSQKRIIAFAAKGERNPDRLCEATLAAMGIVR